MDKPEVIELIEYCQELEGEVIEKKIDNTYNKDHMLKTMLSDILSSCREYEENIRLDYLKRLNEYYNKWIDGYQEGPLLVIDCDKNKFGENEADLGDIIGKIDSTLFGLF